MESRIENPGTQSLPTPDALPFISEPAVARPSAAPLPAGQMAPVYDINWLLHEVQFLRRAMLGLVIGIAAVGLLFGVMYYFADQERNALRDEIRTLKTDYRSLDDRFNLLVDLMVTERDTPAK